MSHPEIFRKGLVQLLHLVPGRLAARHEMQELFRDLLKNSGRVIPLALTLHTTLTIASATHSKPKKYKKEEMGA